MTFLTLVKSLTGIAHANRRFAVKVQGRESEVRGLVVLPGLPVSKGSPVRNERVPGLLSIPAPADEVAVCGTTAIDIRTLT